MADFYGADLAYIQATGFGDFARGAAPGILGLLKAASIPVRRVVEVGCGAGPLTAALVNAGFQVTGIDVSGELLRLAHAACPAAEFIEGSIYDQQIPGYDAILALGEPLTYHNEEGGDSRVREFFRSASDVLPGGGTLIFDLIELGEPSLSARSWKSGDDWAVLVDTTEDQSARTLVREIETFRKMGEAYRRGREVHRVRLFGTDEVCEWLAGEGFAVHTGTSYGQFRLAPRRRAFFCVRR
jgi:SAM-dependent methyltransferase